MTQMQAAPGFTKHPDHRMELSQTDRTYEITFAGILIARSSKAIRLEEGSYQGRLYFPKQDVRMEYLTAIETSTYCPFKGDARYWTLSAGAQTLEGGAWGYDNPYLECENIAGYICFYTEKGSFVLTECDDIAEN